ncbi:MAG: selenocysteine-specific translation elongation factor [Planctomycetes bacterium]|nr:selenocysteine-specific translation elongation factor [Planctomycetota bacterium]
MADFRPVPVVVGTAGHIDHGKSALIEALCGDHPDRWREEKERGITIDLGYAELAWPDGFEVGFVDVPGHERLVRKMVAGATGMGAAMLVVACDDGVMPQTREHFEVLQLLGLRHGLVVLTKLDLADEETLELVRADVDELLAGTSWEGAGMHAVSAHEGAGIDDLRVAVRDLAERARREERSDPAAFRLPVQRSFALHGAGTVATGVCASGALTEGEAVEVQPGGGRSRVRRVHVHGRPAAQAAPGLRTAVNLPDLDPEAVSRGVVLAAPGSLLAGKLLRATFMSLPGLRMPKHGAPVLVLAGTAAVGAKVWLPPEGQASGLEVLVDLELEEEMALVPGQRLLFRRPSPASNLGAGRFLAFGVRRLRKKDAEEREALQGFAEALDDTTNLVASLLDRPGSGEMSLGQIAAALGWRRDAATKILQVAAEAGVVREMSPSRFLGMGRAGELAREIQGVLGHWRGKHAHRLRIPIARLRERLGIERFASLQRLSNDELEVLGLDRRPGLYWGIHGVEVDLEYLADADQWHVRLCRESLTPSSWEEISSEGVWSLERVEALAELLEDQGRAIRVGGTMIFARETVEALRDMVVNQLQGEGMDIPAIRDRFSTSRKFLMPLLEYMDDRGVTVRRGGNRILRDAKATLV